MTLNKFSSKLLAAILFLFYSCTIDTKTTISNGDISIQLEKYSNKQHGFTMQIPSDWQFVGEDHALVFAATMESDTVINSFKNTIHVAKLIDIKENDTLSLDQIVSSCLDDMSSSFEGFQVKYNDRIFVNNLQAAKIKCSFNTNNESITSLIYIIRNTNGVYLIGLSSKSDRFGKYDKLYDHIANTFSSLY